MSQPYYLLELGPLVEGVVFVIVLMQHASEARSTWQWVIPILSFFNVNQFGTLVKATYTAWGSLSLYVSNLLGLSNLIILPHSLICVLIIKSLLLSEEKLRKLVILVNITCYTKNIL